jgi:hypothetical protein
MEYYALHILLSNLPRVTWLNDEVDFCCRASLENEDSAGMENGLFNRFKRSLFWFQRKAGIGPLFVSRHLVVAD